MINPTSCCGLREYQGLAGTPEATMRSFCSDLHRQGSRTSGAYYIFTGTSQSSIDKLSNYIKDKKLGKIWKTGYTKNPNSGNKLMVLLYQPNVRKLLKWYRRTGVNIDRFPGMQTERRGNGFFDIERTNESFAVVFVGFLVFAYILLLAIIYTTVFNEAIKLINSL